MSSVSNVSSGGRSAFDWNVYKDRRTALLYLKRNCIHVDTIIETEDGHAHELVHSQIMSAFGDKLTEFMARNGIPIVQLNTGISKDTTNMSLNHELQHLQHKHHQLAYYKIAGRLKLVRLPKINRYTLGILVDCAYTGFIRTDLTSGGIWQVLEMADYYEMSDVQRACCTFLIKNLNASNCVRFYHIGIKHRHNLQRCAWHQIRANFKLILEANLAAVATAEAASRSNQSAAIAASSNNDQGQPNQQQQFTTHDRVNLDQNSLATIKYEHFEPLLMHDKLNIDNEESVWSAIKLWCRQDLAKRQHLVAKLLPCIRFPRLRNSTEFCSRHIWRDPLILDNKQAQHQLAVLDRNHRDFLTGLSRYSSASVAAMSAVGTTNQSTALVSSGVFRDGFNLPCAVNPRQLRPRIPHSILLAIGGWQQGQPTTLIESYDMNCNLWFESSHKIASTLAYHGIECINGRLYICGGTDGRDILSQVFTFDPVSGECKLLKPMREDRCYVSTSYLNSHLYAMGGHNGVQRLRSVERYNVQEDTWTHVTDMNVARSDASACVYKHLIYIAGGLNDQVIESSVEFYNDQDNSWTFVSQMLIPRTSFTLINYRNSLLAIGGNNGTDRLNSVEQYNFATNVWSQHSQMRHRRSTFSAALVDEGKLFVVGGYNGQTPFAQVEMFDERENQWLQMQKIRYDRSGLKLVVVKDLPNAYEHTFLGSPAANNEYNVGEAKSP